MAAPRRCLHCVNETAPRFRDENGRAIQYYSACERCRQQRIQRERRRAEERRRLGISNPRRRPRHVAAAAESPRGSDDDEVEMLSDCAVIININIEPATSQEPEEEPAVDYEYEITNVTDQTFHNRMRDLQQLYAFYAQKLALMT